MSKYARRADVYGRYLGDLCPNEHEHENTGKTLRGRLGHCLQCRRIWENRWRAKTRQNRNSYAKKLYWNDPDKMRKQKAKRYLKNRESELLRVHAYIDANRDSVRERDKERKRKFRKRSDFKNKACEYRIKNNIRIRLRNRVNNALHSYSRTGKMKTITEYGIDIAEIIKHLGPCPGSSKDWHIDHKSPLAGFDMNDESQIREAFSPENHQWLPANENRFKSAKPYKQWLMEIKK